MNIRKYIITNITRRIHKIPITIIIPCITFFAVRSTPATRHIAADIPGTPNPGIYISTDARIIPAIINIIPITSIVFIIIHLLF